jgi:hypothetical protein
MKQPIAAFGAFGLLSSFVLAGTVVTDTTAPAPTASSDGFAQARRPISNPTLFDLALPMSNVHPIYIHQELSVADVDADIYALQFEFALNDRLSIVATKDGYVDFSGPVNDNGFANLGAGVKYAFILDPASRTAVSGTATLEVPTGNQDVFQGEYDGLINLAVNGLKLVDAWQFAGTIGTQVPFSHDQALLTYVSGHVSYEFCKWFIPLVEVNWFHVIDAGDGGSLINPPFEGGDFFNLGSKNAHENRDIVTAACGFRSRITDSIDAGAAYEIPLTSDDDNLMDSRVTVDLIWKF